WVRRYDLGADVGKFLIGGHVDDLELFGVEVWFRPEGEFAKITLLHFDDELLVLGAQPFQDRRMHGDAELEIRIVARTLFEDFVELALDFDAHGDGTLDLAAA